MVIQDLSYIINRHSHQYLLRIPRSLEGISRPLQVAPLPHSTPLPTSPRQRTPSEATLTLVLLLINNLSRAIARAVAVESV